jgi:hypothetical protein
MSREEKASNTQMRILRLRYDELNRGTSRLVLKIDMLEYIGKLRLLVDRALKNSGFDKQPVYVDRVAGRLALREDIQNKGNVLRR